MGRSKKGAAPAPMIHPGDLVVVHHRMWGRTVVHVHRVSWDGRYIAGPIHESEHGEVGTPLIVPRFGAHASRADISATGTLPLPAAAVPGSTTEIRRDILAAARAEFAEYGLAGARIDHIAQNARVSTEVLYAHFSDKAALFREVVAADRDDYFGALAIDPEAVAEFVGDVFDLTQSHPEHTRLITWARLEGQPRMDFEPDGGAAPQHLLTAIQGAQDAGHIDSSWAPLDLLVMLFGIALAWAQFPDASSAWNDPATLATRRAAAIDAAKRLLAPPR